MAKASAKKPLPKAADIAEDAIAAHEAGEKVTYDDVKRLTLALVNESCGDDKVAGRAKATRLLAEFKAKVATDLKEAQWPAYVAKAQAILAEADVA